MLGIGLPDDDTARLEEVLGIPLGAMRFQLAPISRSVTTAAAQNDLDLSRVLALADDFDVATSTTQSDRRFGGISGPGPC